MTGMSKLRCGGRAAPVTVAPEHRRLSRRPGTRFLHRSAKSRLQAAKPASRPTRAAAQRVTQGWARQALVPATDTSQQSA
jgi:hypothetical protein